MNAEKLAQIRQLTEGYNARLAERLGTTFRRNGGDLFLGNRYASSNRIYLGLNPGGEEGPDYGFVTGLIDKHFWDYVPSPYRYWWNCQQFIKQGPGLHEWLTPATSSMCSPWRTPDWNALYALDKVTDGLVIQFSRMILRTMIGHHRDESGVTIIVAGKAGRYFVADAMGFDWDTYQKYHHGSGVWQWAKAVYKDTVVYQVPHFSRANSWHLLGECARWLSADLNLN